MFYKLHLKHVDSQTGCTHKTNCETLPEAKYKQTDITYLNPTVKKVVVNHRSVGILE